MKKPNLLREYIRESLGETRLELSKKILIPPPPALEERVAELEEISYQYNDRRNPPELQDALDADIALLFNTVLLEAGYPSSYPEIVGMKNKLIPIIMYHKEYFNALRPSALAGQIDKPFEYDYLDSAQTPSYPSGHAAQAFYVAHILSSRYPQLDKYFFDLAEMISQSRVDRGVHFPSDLEAGRSLARKLALSELSNST